MEEQMVVVDSGSIFVLESILAHLVVAKTPSRGRRTGDCVCAGFDHDHPDRWLAIERSIFKIEISGQKRALGSVPFCPS